MGIRMKGSQKCQIRPEMPPGGEGGGAAGSIPQKYSSAQVLGGTSSGAGRVTGQTPRPTATAAAPPLSPPPGTADRSTARSEMEHGGRGPRV